MDKTGKFVGLTVRLQLQNSTSTIGIIKEVDSFTQMVTLSNGWLEFQMQLMPTTPILIQATWPLL